MKGMVKKRYCSPQISVVDLDVCDMLAVSIPGKKPSGNNDWADEYDVARKTEWDDLW